MLTSISNWFTNYTFSEPNYGDLIEIDRGNYSHWAIYSGNGNVVHFRPLGQEINKLLSAQFVPAALVTEESLHKVAGLSYYRVNNKPEVQKQERTCEDISELLDILLHKPVFSYCQKYFNSEHFATFIKFGDAKSSHVNFTNPALSDGFLRELLNIVNDDASVYDFYNNLATYQWQENLQAVQTQHFPQLLLEEGITFLQTTKRTFWSTDYLYCDPDEGDIIEIKRPDYSHWAIYLGNGQVARFAVSNLSDFEKLQTNTCSPAIITIDDLHQVQGICEIRVNNKSKEFENKTTRNISEMLKMIDALVRKPGFFYCFNAFNSEHFVTFVRFGEAKSSRINYLLSKYMVVFEAQEISFSDKENFCDYCNEQATKQWQINLEAAIENRLPEIIIPDVSNLCELDKSPELTT